MPQSTDRPPLHALRRVATLSKAVRRVRSVRTWQSLCMGVLREHKGRSMLETWHTGVGNLFLVTSTHGVFSRRVRIGVSGGETTRPDPTRPDPTRPDPTRPDPTRTDPNRPTSVGGPLLPLSSDQYAIFAPDVEAVTAEVLAWVPRSSKRQYIFASTKSSILNYAHLPMSSNRPVN